MANSTNKQRIDDVTAKLVIDTSAIEALPSTSDATATAGDIISGKTAYVDGTKITGTISDLLSADVSIDNINNLSIETIDNVEYLWAKNGILGSTYANKLTKSSTLIGAFLPTANISNVAGLTSAKLVSGNTILGVTGSAITLNGETKTITPTTSQQTITPTSPKNGFTEVTVEAVDNTIDANIIAGNIKQGVTVLGVTGTFTSDADAEAINIKRGKTAYVDGSKITGTLPVKTYPTNPEDPSDYDYQFIASTSDKSVTRDGTNYILGSYQVASQSDPDSWMFEGNRKMKMGISYSSIASVAGLTANKLKEGVTVLGVTGNVIPLKGETKTVTPTTSQQIITPSSNKNGITQVTVNAVTSSIDNNITAGNIKKDITILGVTGTFDPSTTYNSRIYNNIVDMNNNIVSDGVMNGDYATVYQPYEDYILTGPVVSGETYTEVTFPETVTLSSSASPYSYNNWINMGSVGSAHIVLNGTSFQFSISYPSFSISYTSSDGINFSTTAEQILQVSSGITIPTSSNWNSLINEFMWFEEQVIHLAEFAGVFQYNGVQYDLVDTQLDATDSDVVSGKWYYGSNGLSQGNYSSLLPIDVHSTGMKCTNNYLTTLDGTFDLSNIDDTDLARGIFEDCTMLTGFVDDDPNGQDEWHYITNILHSQNSGKSPNFCKGLFKGCENLDCNFDYSNSPQFNYSSGNPYFDLSYMFYNCTSLTTVPQLFNIGTYVKDISYMFYNCYNLRWDYDPNELIPPSDIYKYAYELIHSFSSFDSDKLEDWKGFIEGVSTPSRPAAFSFDTIDEILIKFQNITSDSYYGSPSKCTLKYLGVSYGDVGLYTNRSIWITLLQHGWTTGY